VARGANQTVRFTQVVERSGRPQVHTLWVPPEQDAEFKRARDSHRLMTIESGSISGKADAGLVGFDSAHRDGGQFLIFPKSLKRFEGSRVIGIKFDLIEQPPLAPVKHVKRAKPPRVKPQRKVAFSLPPREEPKREPDPRAEAKTPQRKEANAAEPPAPEEKVTPRKRSADHAALIREVRAAIKDLQRDKPLAAYQRLERALAGNT
jgi:hypothetical protein